MALALRAQSQRLKRQRSNHTSEERSVKRSRILSMHSSEPMSNKAATPASAPMDVSEFRASVVADNLAMPAMSDGTAMESVSSPGPVSPLMSNEVATSTSAPTDISEFPASVIADDVATPVVSDGTAMESVSSLGPVSATPHPTVIDMRPSRTHRLPRRYRDELPEPMPAAVATHSVDRPSLPRRVVLHVFDSFRTAFNKFGIARDYRHRPSYDPDSFLSVSDLSDLPTLPNNDDNNSNELPGNCEDCYGSSGARAPPWPWANMSIWRLMSWKLTGTNQKSNNEVTRLVNDVIQAADFKVDDLTGFNASSESKRLGAKDVSGPPGIFDRDDWKEAAAEIVVPTREKQKGAGHTFVVPGFMYRPLTSVIEVAFSEPISKWFHFIPFKRIWKSASGREQRIFDELYSSDVWNKAHDEIQKQKRDDNCRLERVIAGLMFWSDSTQLAQFGHSSAWPVYLFFGNLSKYIRASVAPGTCHPIAFIPPLPPSLVNFVKQQKGHSDILTHCKRELFHTLWNVLLDDDFLRAYKNGIIVKCFDGNYRRVYPRIFTYSADYPEKILLATIRDKGHYPCPQCLIPKSNFWRVGLWSDVKARVAQARTYLRSRIVAARDAIYRLGAPIKGTIVERLLKDYSLVPTLNAFTERLSPLGFELFSIIVVDFMHEFELGILKNVLKHLIRILYVVNPANVATLNERYLAVPPFNRGGIRRFPADVAEMKQKTAQHFENMLQCAIPVFDGLFPDEHDTSIRILLFRLAEWHALAKLRLHTEDSVKLLEQSLRMLTTQLRHFAEVTCAAFQTKELPSEVAARRRQQKQTENQGGGPRRKTFNMFTYKIHALGDYVRSIQLLGTTDSYTTQIGEHAHSLIKKFYGLASKRDTLKQLARQERRFAHIQRQEQLENPLTFEVSDLDTIPVLHHVLSSHRTDVVNLRKFIFDLHACGDPAITHNFISKLKDHLLSRLYQYEYDGDEHQFTALDHSHLHFVNNLNDVTESKTFRVNYTSYDIRRQQDFMRPGYGCTVMVLSREDGPTAHPFWYAQVVRAFHVPIIHVAPDARNRSQQIMEVLWVRWLGTVPGYRWGFKEACLPKVGFIPATDDNAFGFLEPSFVIRGCHLIPAFSEGRTDTLLKRGESIARQPGETDDWRAFYVNIFADRDMFSRFAGIGVGHKAQYNVKTTTDDNPFEDDTLPMADTEDEGDTTLYADKESFYRFSSPHGDNGHTEGEEDDDDNKEGESSSQLFDDDDDSGLDCDSEGDSDNEASFTL